MKMTNEMPLISICVPTYNRAKYLNRCIRSIIGYQGSDIEIIIQDNASTDDTEEVVSSYNDGRLKYYKNAENVGIEQNFIRIISRASGQYVYVLTDDDMLLPDAIDILKEYINKHSPDAFKSDLIIYLEKTKACNMYSYFKEDKYPGNLSIKDIANIFMSAHIFTGLCFKKDRLDYNFLKQYGNNWYPSMLVIGLMNRNVGYIAQPTAIHVWENETSWGIEPSNRIELNQGIINIIKSLENKLDKNIYKEVVKTFLFKYQSGEEILSHCMNKNELIKIKLAIYKKIIKNYIIRAATIVYRGLQLNAR